MRQIICALVLLFLTTQGLAAQDRPPLTAVQVDSGAVRLDYTTDRFEYRVRFGTGTFGPWTRVPADRIVRGLAAGDYRFQVRSPTSETASVTVNTAPPPTDGFPDATNTGVPPGTVLTNSAAITSTSVGQVIENVRVSGYVILRHDNVVLRNCEVSGDAVVIDAINVTVQNCTFLSSFPGSNSAIAVHGSGARILRNNIKGAENGIIVSQGPIAIPRSVLIEGNYIHDLTGSASAHIDGIQLFTAEAHDVIIRNNSVMLANVDATSCIIMRENNNVLIENNRLHGGGYTIYVQYQTGVQILNNRFGPFVFGRITVDGPQPIISGNVDDATGQPIPGQTQ